jgi:LacI family transcriptional regulator
MDKLRDVRQIHAITTTARVCGATCTVTFMGLTDAKSVKQGIRAVAARAGVSTASVSRALNNPDAVSPSLRVRIEQAIDALGYIPHAPARILSSRRSRTLGAIVPTIDNTMFARGIASLQHYLSSVGYMLFLTTSGYDLDVELQQARNLISRGVDGLVLRGDCHHDGLRKLLADNAVPFINYKARPASLGMARKGQRKFLPAET